jgi:hypothetical protein
MKALRLSLYDVLFLFGDRLERRCLELRVSVEGKARAIQYHEQPSYCTGMEARHANGVYEQFPELARDLAKSQVAIISLTPSHLCGPCNVSRRLFQS